MSELLISADQCHLLVKRGTYCRRDPPADQRSKNFLQVTEPGLKKGFQPLSLERQGWSIVTFRGQVCWTHASAAHPGGINDISVEMDIGDLHGKMCGAC